MELPVERDIKLLIDITMDLKRLRPRVEVRHQRSAERSRQFAAVCTTPAARRHRTASAELLLMNVRKWHQKYQRKEEQSLWSRRDPARQVLSALPSHTPTVYSDEYRISLASRRPWLVPVLYDTGETAEIGDKLSVDSDW